MIISHNLAASNTLRRLQESSKAGSSRMEKLSSGFRINKASDDAAGLAISEKMRAQIRGLDQASRNILDGTSVLQTAEGGLDEITSILQRQRELIIQGLNDTNTDQDRQMIDQEIRQLTNEIDSISTKTEFNTINLLARDDYEILADRSNSNTVHTFSDPPPTTTIHKSVVYKPPGESEEPRHLVSSIDTSVTSNTLSNTSTITPIVLPDSREGYNEYTVDTSTTNVTDTTTTVHESLQLSNDPKYSEPSYWYSVGMNKTSFGPESFADVYGSLFENVEVNGSTRALEYTSRSNRGTVPAWDHMWFPGTNLSITRFRTILPDNSMELKYVINNGDPSDSSFKLSNVMDPPVNSVIYDASGNPLPAGNNVITPPSGNTFTMTGTNANAAIMFDDSLGYASPTELEVVNNPVGGQSQINFDWDLTIPSGSSITLGFSYGPFSLNMDVFEFTRETEITKHIDTTIVTDITDIDYRPPNLDIQLGANKGQTVYIPLFNVKATGLGLTRMGLLPPADPNQALAQTDRALGKVTNYRSIYGALQNRMEHALNNTNNSAINLTSAESRIRDADMNKELLGVTKSNILTQAAQAMLAQANQNPQAVLQLLK
jgi:flagellin